MTPPRPDDVHPSEASAGRTQAPRWPLLLLALPAKIHPDERTMVTLLDSEATKRNVMVAIGETLPRVVEDDAVLIYFAGHGSPESDAPHLARRAQLQHGPQVQLDLLLGQPHRRPPSSISAYPEWRRRPRRS